MTDLRESVEGLHDGDCERVRLHTSKSACNCSAQLEFARAALLGVVGECERRSWRTLALAEVRRIIEKRLKGGEDGD